MEKKKKTMILDSNKSSLISFHVFIYHVTVDSCFNISEP